MKEKDLKKLSRAELLELLLLQTKKTEELEARLTEVQQALEQQQFSLNKAGSIAEAALSVNGVFEAAQTAADQYLKSIELMEKLTRETCRNMERVTTEKCQKLLRKAGGTEKLWDEIRDEVIERTVQAVRDN